MSGTIRVEYNELKAFAVKVESKSRRVNSEITEAIKKSVLTISKEAKSNLANNGSVDTGHLRRSIATKVKATEGEVHTSNLKYAIYVEEGTRPHVIKAKKKKYLYWEGAKHPVRQVKHPGSKEKPYLVPAFNKETPEFIKRLEKVVTEFE